MDDRIEELIVLARQKTAHSRRVLFENLTDLFLSEEGRLSEHERALMSDIMTKLVRAAETDVRRELSNIFVKTEADLPDVVRLLANDEIEVARPLLEQSTLLRDPDLVEIVRMRTDEHRIAIAMREQLSEDVSDAVVEYGNEDAIEALLRNSDAAISKRAMEYLVAESRRADRFQEPLVSRDDLPVELAYRMYWWVSAALRKRIVAEFDVDAAQVDAAVNSAARAVLADQEDRAGAFVKAQRLVRRMAETGDLSVEFLTAALRQRRIGVFVAGLAELGGIDFRTAWRIFGDRSGESLAVLARAIGVERGQFTTVYLLLLQAREGERARKTAMLTPILKLFDSISPRNARGALQYWQRDSAYQVALEELEDVG